MYLNKFRSVSLLVAIVSVFVFTISHVRANTQTSCVDLLSNQGYGFSDYADNGSITSLQQYLSNTGYLNSQPTGYFGQLTRAAIVKFQTDHNIQATGYVGQLTRAAIKNASCNTGEGLVSGSAISSNPLSSNSGGGGNYGIRPGIPGQTVTCPRGFTCTPLPLGSNNGIAPTADAQSSTMTPQQLCYFQGMTKELQALNDQLNSEKQCKSSLTYTPQGYMYNGQPATMEQITQPTCLSSEAQARVAEQNSESLNNYSTALASICGISSYQHTAPTTKVAGSAIDIYGVFYAAMSGNTFVQGVGISYERNGNMITGSNGKTYLVSGNKITGSDGSSYLISGNAISSSNGTMYLKSGDTMSGSDGSSASISRGFVK